ncbi:hypothetical protein KP509_04G066700 [Ceratopteris richardii]|uniref:CS domain-containing protein n=1 Tax=Ceratopteris richardii TaxID=49495 RepID=A0A8T2V1A8_CERRI|nr:hypothetical protein KP509_04G066700 [Ceratopteris richardii]
MSYMLCLQTASHGVLKLGYQLCLARPVPSPCHPLVCLVPNPSRVLRFSTHAASYRALASTYESPTSDYEFRDDKGEVELKFKLPAGNYKIGASNVFVDAQDTCISVALALPNSLLNVLPSTRLYGRIKASETVWFVDEEEIVISLKKLDKEITWPGLVEDWENLSRGVSKLLKGVPVYLVGESSEINRTVAQKLAEGLQYVPLLTVELLEKATKKSLKQMITEDGVKAVSDAEAVIMRSLNSHGRVVVGTLGGEYGAAFCSGKWACFHAGVTIWLSQSTAADEQSAEAEAKRARQEQSKAYANAEAVVALSGWQEEGAQQVAEGCLRALKYLLETDKTIAGKKNLYVRLGCQGDWRNVSSPGLDLSNA